MMKKIILFLIYLLFFFILMSSVCGADLNSTDNPLEIHAEDSVISTDVSETFDNLRKAINISNQISLTSDIINTDEYEIFIGNGQNITINGNGYVIDGNKIGRLFTIYKGGQLTLINAKLTNGYLPFYLDSDYDGGAIINNGILIINDCEFYDNYAHNGGAIAAGNEATTILSGTNYFHNNHVWQDGGAIANFGGSTLIIRGNNTFESNNAFFTGTAVIPVDEGKGGAIINAFASPDNPNKKSYLYIEGENIFKQNIVNSDGAAIFNHQAIANITGKNTFVGNFGVHKYSKGGAINNENATLYLSGDNIFRANKAYRGGAIDNNLFESIMTIDGKNQFIDNTGNMGGAISNQESTRLNIYGENTFTNNKANFGDGANIGGAIYSYKSYLNIDAKNTFMNNNAAGSGGAIYFANNLFSMKGSNTFKSNSAPMAGAMLLINTPRVDLLGKNIFDSNTASTSGGAIRANNVFELILGNHNYFTNNRASHGGGAIYTQSSVLNSQGSLFEGNTAQYGGAIFLENTAFAGNYNIFKNNVGSITGSDIESYQSSINSLEYNYWNSQNKVSQNNIHNYDVSNIKNWVILDLSIPSEIKQNINTEVVSFKDNNYGNLKGEMPDYAEVNAYPNFSPSKIIVSKNVGISKYVGNLGEVTVSADANDFFAMKRTDVVDGRKKTSLNANNIILDKVVSSVNYEVTLTDVNGKTLSGKTITIVVDGVKYVKTTNNKGKASLTLNNLENGYHEVVSSYAGETNFYYGTSITSCILCLFNNESTTNLIGKDFEMFYKDGSRYSVTLTDADNKPLTSKNIKIIINNVVYNRVTDSEGKASIAINLNAGEVNITAVFAGDDKNGFAFAENTVIIKSTIECMDIVKYFRNGTQYYAKFLDSKGNPLKNADVKFNINGVLYTRTTNENGYARMNINLNPGEYIITAMHPNGETHANLITVLSILEGNDLVKYYRNDSQYYIKVLNNDGTPAKKGETVRFNINGVFYNRTVDEKGFAKLNINLNPGEYIITTEYKGLQYSNNIKVLPILTAEDLLMKYKDGRRFKAKLVDGQGNPVSGKSIQFNVNGVLYNRNTNDEGYAALNINLMPGVYIITSSYDTAIISNKISISK